MNLNTRHDPNGQGSARGLAVLRLCCLALVLASSMVLAAEDRITLDADSAELDQATGISVYVGNVVLTRGDREVTGDRMTVHTSPGQQLSHVVVTGEPARFSRPAADGEEAVQGEALRIEYYASGPERMILQGRGKVLRGRDEFTGETIDYNIERDLVEARGDAETGERVRITLFPEQSDGSR